MPWKAEMKQAASMKGIESQLSEAVQNRAIRSFLGVHKFSANLAINGDMGWENCTIRKKIKIFGCSEQTSSHG